MEMRYKREDVAYSLSECREVKVKLTDNKPPNENIWVAHKDGDENCFLLNHALALHPFSSWGSMCKYGTIDVSKFKEEENPVMSLHPEAFDSMLEAGFINEEGYLTEKYFEDQKPD
jgi:hypothetical protein